MLKLIKRYIKAPTGGWYAMYRGWQDHPVFKDEPYTEREAWEWLISNAVFHPAGICQRLSNRPQFLSRGQCSYSIRFMAEKWDWDRSKVERYLKKLKKNEMIKTDNTTAQLVITLSNYNKFQYMSDENKTDEETVIEAL